MVATPDKPLGPSTTRNNDSNSDPADQVYVHLSERDRDIVLETIEADTQPNDELKSLAQRFKERYG